MSSESMNPVLLIGGSGVVGSRAAGTLRHLQPHLPIAIAGRDSKKAAAAAAGVGGPTTTVAVDLGRADLGLPAGAAFSAVVVLLKDHLLNSMKYAQAHGLPYVAFSDFVTEIGPVVARYIHRPASAPILMLGHLIGGVATLATLHFSKAFRRVDSIALGTVVSASDTGGPAAQADFERVAQAGQRPLILEDGVWTWAGGANATRRFRDSHGVEREGQAIGLLDVPSLAAATDARSIRVDLAVSESTRPATEVVIEIAGELHDGTSAKTRHALIDADVHARLSAHGAALATERLLGLAGGPPVAPGLHHPEGLLDPGYVLARLEEQGVRIVKHHQGSKR